jgi:hypothetical protein
MLANIVIALWYFRFDLVKYILWHQRSAGCVSICRVVILLVITTTVPKMLVIRPTSFTFIQYFYLCDRFK